MEKIAIITSGGDAPGMNACLRAITRYALYNNFEVYGVERGYAGLLSNNINKMTSRSVSDIIQRGGTILKTARCVEFKELESQKIAAQNLRALGINNVIVIGGDGSFKGAKALSDNFGVNVVGIPATIDNDLAYTDYTLGFDTAVNTVISAINNIKDTMGSHDRVSLVEVMGNNCGDIAVYAAAAGGAEYCLIPEKSYKIEDVANSLMENHKKGKISNIIVLAEGGGDRQQIHDRIKELTGISVKITTLGHIQRGGAPSMADRVLAARFAKHAVDTIIAKKTNRVVGIKENKIFDQDISDALAVPRKVDEELYQLAHILSL